MAEAPRILHAKWRADLDTGHASTR